MDILPIKYPENMVFGLSNCGIVAMAICAGVSLDTATEWFRAVQRPNRNWQGSTRHVHYDRFLREYGKWFNRVDYDRTRIRTVGDFAEWFAKPGTIYAIRSAGHCMTVKDGYILDQSQIAKARDHWKRNARIKNHWEILG